MGKDYFVDLLVKQTILKAKKEGKHPFAILEEVKRLIEQKRTMERQRIIQTVSKKGSVN